MAFKKMINWGRQRSTTSSSKRRRQREEVPPAIVDYATTQKAISLTPKLIAWDHGDWGLCFYASAWFILSSYGQKCSPLNLFVPYYFIL